MHIQYKNKKPLVSIKLLTPRNSLAGSLGINSSVRHETLYDRRRFISGYRLIRFCVSVAVIFLVLAAVSFFSVLPTLKEIRSEVQINWQNFLREVRNRNELLPGLMESIRGFDSGHGRLSEKLFQARSLANRSTDPHTIVAASDDIDDLLRKIEKLAAANPDLSRYSPFVSRWDQVAKASRRIAFARMAYNSSSRLYNQLLATFPHNLFTSIAGFLPVNSYPAVNPSGEN